jgi:anti-sigma regulatory factor (Ser/Thr protein kinase)
VNRNSGHFVFSHELMAHMELAPLPTTARCARSLARSMLGQWGMPADTIETAELLVSELVTNAVRFTAGAEFITLTLRSLPRRIVIEVADANSNPPFLADADVEAESGRRLMLVQALSKEWSYLLPPSGGKIVYCVIDSSDQVNAVKSEESYTPRRESL